MRASPAGARAPKVTTPGCSTIRRIHWSMQLSQATLFGVDVTDFLDNALTRSPVTLYLFHVVRSLLDGRKLVCWMDEFWRLLGRSGV